jgi:carbamate kinase
VSAPTLAVVALGGNLLSPPAGDLSVTAERAVGARAMREVAALAAAHRLLVLPGNGPQVGRLLEATGHEADLAVLVAMTQGELGDLLCEALDTALGMPASVAIVTRVLVDPTDPAFASPTKPVGRVLRQRPADGPAMPTPDGGGWRRVVASPRPVGVLELEAIRSVLGTHHVVAGGGGGVPLVAVAGGRAPRPAVVDKDRVGALLAIALGAQRLIFVTDVPAACDGFGGPAPRPISRMSVAGARARLAAGAFAEGSMGPKVESAADFADATGRPAVITTLGAIEEALGGKAGTTVSP